MRNLNGHRDFKFPAESLTGTGKTVFNGYVDCC